LYVWEDRALFELLTIISTNPTMNRAVKVPLSSRSLMASSAGPTIKEKPAMAVSFPSVLTGVLNNIAHRK